MKHFCSPPNPSPSLSLRTARISDCTPSRSPLRLSKRSFRHRRSRGLNPPPSCSKQPCPPFTKLLVLWWWHLSACAAFFLRSFPAPTDVLDKKRPTGPFFSRRLSRKGSFEHLTPHFSISPLVLRGPDSNRPRGPARRVLSSTTRLLHESADSTFFFSRVVRSPKLLPQADKPNPSIEPFDSIPLFSLDLTRLGTFRPFSQHRQRHNSSSAERWL